MAASSPVLLRSRPYDPAPAVKHVAMIPIAPIPRNRVEMRRLENTVSPLHDRYPQKIRARDQRISKASA